MKIMNKSFWWTLIGIILVWAATPAFVGMIFSAQLGYWFLLGEIFLATVIMIVALVVMRESEANFDE